MVVKWVGFKGKKDLLFTLYETFVEFSKKYPDAAGHLKYIDISENLLSGQGSFSNDGFTIKIDRASLSWMTPFDITEILVHELGHLLHQYLENIEGIKKHIYNFTRINKPKDSSVAPSEYATKNRFEAFAEGFAEMWLKPKVLWSKYSNKLYRILNILFHKFNCKMTIEKVKSVWSFINFKIYDWITQGSSMGSYINLGTYSSTSTSTSTSKDITYTADTFSTWSGC